MGRLPLNIKAASPNCLHFSELCGMQQIKTPFLPIKHMNEAQMLSHVLSFLSLAALGGWLPPVTSACTDAPLLLFHLVSRE